MFKNLLKRVLPTSASTAAAPSPEDVARSDALIAEGNRVEDAGDVAGAVALYRQAVDAAPGHVRAHLNLGIALAALGDKDGAIKAYQAGLRIDRSHPFVNYNFARLIYPVGELARAEAMLHDALRLKPEFPEALLLLGTVLDERDKTEAAIEPMKRALRLQPENAGGWFNLAVMYRRLKRNDDAEDAIRHVVALEPQRDAFALLSHALRENGLNAQALEHVRQAIALDPSRLDFRSDELLLMNSEEDIAAAELFERHVDFGKLLERSFPARFEHSKGDAEPRRRLRVGYVSADFCTHPVTLFLLPVLELHDHADFEIFCYSTTGSSEDERMTPKVKAAADHWIEASEMNDAQLADAVRADAIDILVDLSGHTRSSRLPMFSQRPAPIQVAWLGYLNTTGLTRMDYRLCDRRTDPMSVSQPFHTEQLVYLPDSQWAYRPFVDVDVAQPAPFQKNGYITFGSFNGASKVTAATSRRWAELVSRVPGSRLRVSDCSLRKRTMILSEMEIMGVSPDRVDFMPRLFLGPYFQSYGDADIALDTFPYGGGTTTFDSLWMGVPVVTTRGPTPVSRSAASVMTALGLEEWVAPSIDDFVDVAVARANDRDAIAALRRSLRQRLKDSPLTDLDRFTRNLESLYRAMWTAHLEGRKLPLET